MEMLCVVTLLATAQITAQAQAKTNFIILLADDLGYGDLGTYGHPTIQTPNLDRMAAEGMKFTQFCVAAATCTPSRVGLVTGRLPIRSGVTQVLIPSSTGGLPKEEITLAEILRERGYATAWIGKWHLGWQDQYLPGNHGFDYYFGIPYSNDMSPETQPGNPVFKEAPPTPLIRNSTTTNMEREPDQRLLTKQYTEEAIKFIKSAGKEKPFLLYLAYTMPHVPLYASEEFVGKSRRGLYGDTVEEIDWSYGQIANALKSAGIDSNTMVVFTSDNGPWLNKKLYGGSAGPFFEGKVSTWEGGFRVPAIFRWPNRIKAGVTTAAFGTTMDLFTTFVRIAGGRLPADREIDGVDLSPVLLANEAGREALLFYYFGTEMWAIRKGPWKVHFKTTRPASVSVWGQWKVEEHSPPLLFNVEEDPGEQVNRAASERTLVEELSRVAERHRTLIVPGKIQR